MGRGVLAAAVPALLCGAACLQNRAVECADGRVCPVGTTCDQEAGRCVSDDQKAACDGLAEGDPCTFGSPGVCRNGFCEVPFCGDGVRALGEDCDGADLGVETCMSQHFYQDDPGLGCKPDCTFDFSGCSGKCPDGIRNGGETCDGDDLGTADCISAGFYFAGGLTCTPFCTWDVSGCSGECGDGVINGPELCDGEDPAGYCIDYGFYAGPIQCGAGN